MYYYGTWTLLQKREEEMRTLLCFIAILFSSVASAADEWAGLVPERILLAKSAPSAPEVSPSVGPIKGLPGRLYLLPSLSTEQKTEIRKKQERLLQNCCMLPQEKHNASIMGELRTDNPFRKLMKD